MRIHAAVLWEQGQPLAVEAAELDAPGPGEVLVEIKAAGVCHSDLHPARGDWPIKTPLVLGHEGAGIVREVGPSVTKVRPGDHVVLCWAPACGVCPPCREGRSVLCDRAPIPLALSVQFGATHTLEASDEVAKAVREITAGRGADFVFDSVGSPSTLTTALNCARKGGAVVLTGLSRADSQGSIAMFPFVMQEKRLLGSVYGSGQPARDIPRLVSLFQQGKLKLRELVSRSYALDGVNDALGALEASEGARGIIQW